MCDNYNIFSECQLFDAIAESQPFENVSLSEFCCFFVAVRFFLLCIISKSHKRSRQFCVQLMFSHQMRWKRVKLKCGYDNNDSEKSINQIWWGQKLGSGVTVDAWLFNDIALFHMKTNRKPLKILNFNSLPSNAISHGHWHFGMQHCASINCQTKTLVHISNTLACDIRSLASCSVSESCDRIHAVHTANGGTKHSLVQLKKRLLGNKTSKQNRKKKSLGHWPIVILIYRQQLLFHLCRFSTIHKILTENVLSKTNVKHQQRAQRVQRVQRARLWFTWHNSQFANTTCTLNASFVLGFVGQFHWN